MASEHKQHIQVTESGDSVRRKRVVEHSPSTQAVLVSRITKLLWLLTTVVISLIALRFFFLLLGANPANEFVDLIISVTDIFVAPFSNILNSPTFEGNAVFDTASLIAMVVYLLASWVIISLFRIIFSDSGSTRHVSTIEKTGV